MNNSQILREEWSVTVASIDVVKICEMYKSNPELLDHASKNSICSMITLTGIVYKDSKSSRLLLDCFKDVDFESVGGFNNTAELIIAVENHDMAMIEFLLKRNSAAKTKEMSSSILLAIHIFSVSMRKELLRLLFRYGFDVGLKSEPRGGNLLDHLALYVRKDDIEAVELAEILMDHGVSFSDFDRDGSTPFHQSVRSGNVDLVEFLLKMGADVNMRKNVEPESPEMMKFLLRVGADIDRLFRGETALHEACRANDESIIGLLIRKGADLDAINRTGETPVSLLDPRSENYERCLLVVVKEVAKFLVPDVGKGLDSKRSFMDSILDKSSAARAHYEKCMKELELMRSVKFYEPYSYFFVMRMSRNLNKLAHFTKNQEFVSTFEANVGKFSLYEVDLRRILKEAIQVKDNAVAVESRLRIVFDDMLPDVVIRRLTNNLKLKDLPLQ